MKPQDSEVGEIVTEIRLAERRRAQKLAKDTILSEWVKNFRQKYIADGFLTPLYSWDGGYFRSKKRIKEYGNFVLPYEMVGKVFYEEVSRGWIRQESMWFWEYLISGQQIIYSRELSEFPDHMKLGDMPANAVWQELVQITTQLGYFGENSGGILLSPWDLDKGHLKKMGAKKGWQEGEGGYLEPYPRPSHPRWIDVFQKYECKDDFGLEIEMRPAWFHVANYVFFDAPIRRLAVFSCIFNTQGKIDKLSFLDEHLSDRARASISNSLFNMPMEVVEQLSGDAIRRERQEMTWWLWHYVGHDKQKRTLSYGEIAQIIEQQRRLSHGEVDQIKKQSRSTVQTSVERFNKKLQEKLDSKLLERLLLMGGHLGLGHNLTYNALANRGLVPKRERGIDSFDRLDKLI